MWASEVSARENHCVSVLVSLVVIGMIRYSSFFSISYSLSIDWGVIIDHIHIYISASLGTSTGGIGERPGGGDGPAGDDVDSAGLGDEADSTGGGGGDDDVSAGGGDERSADAGGCS